MQGRTQRGGGGATPPPPKFSKHFFFFFFFFFYTQILDFHKIVSVNQKIMQLK